MGCCISTSKQPIPAPNGHRRFSAARSVDSKHSRAPPPPPFLEEETVKEVLSETPTPKLSYPKIDDKEEKKTPKSILHKIDEDDDINVDKKPLMAAGEQISEVSEICSLSESVSTTTFTEKRDDDEDGEVRQRVDRSPAKLRNRSFSGEFSSKRDRVVGKSPARRGDPSPGRVRIVPGRERRGLVTDGQRRDVGESSGRRSRSPATRTDGGGGLRPGLGRSPSSKRSGKSPGRVQSEPNGTTRKVDGANREGKSAPTNESLENPLVSLECFIFL